MSAALGAWGDRECTCVVALVSSIVGFDAEARGAATIGLWVVAVVCRKRLVAVMCQTDLLGSSSLRLARIVLVG